MSSIKSKLAAFSTVVFLGVACIVMFSYHLAVREVRRIMETDVISVADALEKSLDFIATGNNSAYKDDGFKKLIYSIKIGKSGYPFLLDEQGTLVVHYKEEGKNLAGETHIDHIRAHKEGGIYSYTAKTTGQKKIVAFRYIKPWNLWVVPGVNEADYFEQMKVSFLKWNLLFAALIIAVLCALCVWITGGITGPINHAISVANRLAQGDLTVEIQPRGNSEGSQLLAAMKNMLERFKGILLEVNHAAQQVAANSGQLNSSAQQISEGVKKVEEQSGTVATAGEEMSATSCDISQNCRLAAQGAKIASEAAEVGAKVVDETIAVMNNIAGQVERSAKAVESLGSRSDQIGEIVATIEDIADQTNLLALNAAIEAARAGEQGRGFAVVADEVRALAERTTRATREISDMIKTIQQETKGAVSSMEEGVVEVSRGSEKAAGSGKALENILDQITAVAGQIELVATAAGEQTMTTTEISRNMLQITQVVSKTSRGADESAAAASDLSRLAEELHRMVGQFRLA